MPPAKKLQVFVSSTYTDLREERQAAVEAILTAGHIPAGMELFTAGDQSQMDVIRRWIDESDVFLLILGGRYGTLEPTTGKSYTHLEYEYALEREKPLFAVVITDEALERRIRKGGRKIVEIDNARHLNEFRDMVLSRMVRFWGDLRDIKLAVLETMGEFSRRPELVGWVPGDQAVSGSLLAEEIARITKENSELRIRLATSGTDQVKINGLSFEELRQLLRQEIIDSTDLSPEETVDLVGIRRKFGDSTLNLEQLLWRLQDLVVETNPPNVSGKEPSFRYYKRLEFYGLIRLEPADSKGYAPLLRTDGRSYLFRLMSRFPELVSAAGLGKASSDLNEE